MPVTYNIDKAKRTIRTRCSGNVTLAEVLEHFRTLEQDTDRPDSLHVLLDLTETTSMPGFAEIMTVGEAIRAIRKTIHFGICAVAVESDVLFGMARTFEMVAAAYFDDVRVFRGVSAAEEWFVSRVQNLLETSS